MANTCRHTDRGLVSVDGNIVHLVEVVVQEALLGVGLDDLAQGLSAQLLGGQSWRLAVDPLWRPDGAKERGRGRGKVRDRDKETETLLPLFSMPKKAIFKLHLFETEMKKNGWEKCSVFEQYDWIKQR